ncbi:MAG: hypothetical protein JXP72_06195 [Coriobacteriia bacterium]|nr:hypothetical protein [Coriobacteriia bacterium]
MPGTWRAHVIAERLKAAGIPATVMESDVFVLEGDERRAILDAVVAEHADFPMVLVDGIVACHGGIDVDAVMSVAERQNAPADAGVVAAAAGPVTTPDAAVPVAARPEGGCCSGGCC